MGTFAVTAKRRLRFADQENQTTVFRLEKTNVSSPFPFSVCVCIYVWVYIYVYVCVYIYIYIYWNSSIYTVYIHIYLSLYIYQYLYMYIDMLPFQTGAQAIFLIRLLIVQTEVGRMSICLWNGLAHLWLSVVYFVWLNRSPGQVRLGQTGGSKVAC